MLRVPPRYAVVARQWDRLPIELAEVVWRQVFDAPAALIQRRARAFLRGAALRARRRAFASRVRSILRRYEI